LDKAQEFARTFGAATAHGTYQDLFADETIDAIYIATPHVCHRDNAIAALAAGKHVLVEKPIGLNHAEAMEIFDAAEQAGLFAMEAFMYRCHPQTEKILDLVRSGSLGEVRHISSSFGFQMSPTPGHRLFEPALGGGGILDVGCYPVSAVRAIAKAALDNSAAEPLTLGGNGHLGNTGVDEWAAAHLSFEGDIQAHVTAAITVNLPWAIDIYGSTAALAATNTWHVADPKTGASALTLMPIGGDPQTIDTTDPRSLYAIEAETVSAAILHGKTQSPAMDWADSLGNMAALDRWRGQIGLVYPAERTANLKPSAGLTHARAQSLEQAPKKNPFPALSAEPSRLVLGCDNQETMPHAKAIFDNYFRLGGNTFDTAHIYGGGRMETLLGQWMSVNQIRDQVILIGKGAHTPHCAPEHIELQLVESLDRLQADHIDLYFLHRDDPDIPVGEWLDALNAQVAAGRIKYFGGSNWSLERVKDLQTQAQMKDVQGFHILSNQFSLAQMLQPIWPGCVSSNTKDYVDFLTASQIALFPWSAQARGFFTDQIVEGSPFYADLARCFFSKENFARKEKAEKIARELGVSTTEVALAYVLAQPFATYPLIGPRQLSETRSSFKAQAITLTPDQLASLTAN
jgi:aryl-alcohol dehydrogenase-like predicted oxidoreductase/predicted dehydrogenase